MTRGHIALLLSIALGTSGCLVADVVAVADWDPVALWESLLDTRESIALSNGDRVEYEYCSCADSGVRVTCCGPDGTVRWRTVCADLGVVHSIYFHHVTAVERDGALVVESRASGGDFTEVLDFSTGRTISRVAELAE